MTDVAQAKERHEAESPGIRPHIRMWHGLASLDLTEPPIPVLRWTGVVLTGIIYAALGAPTRLGDWLWANAI